MSEIEVQIPKKAFLPCYHHLLDSASDIDFLWGGRDSGKSRFIASILIKSCLELPYFRCVLARKVFNTIKESQWQMIKDVATMWGVDHLFTFNKNPLEIHCVNGNSFICRGMDDSANLKSISNPSHCWAEEMNQMDMDDFILIMTSLRANVGNIKMWCSFNPEADGDFNDYWLYTTFFQDKPGNTFSAVWQLDIPAVQDKPAQVIDFVYSSTHTTYHDNRYCKPQRIAFLEKLADLDPYYYKVFTLGEWGNRKNEDPFCYTFDKAKHVKPTALNRAYEVKLSFDFNVNPITCGVIQDYKGYPEVIEAIKLANSDIYKLCEYITVSYPGCLFVVTGDATGQNTSALVQDGINYYTVIKSKLGLSQGQLKVPSVNPKVKENRVLVNSVFHQLPVAIDPVKGKALIYDCENVSVNDMGDIDKGDRSNPKKRADHLDWWRYYCNTFWKHILKQ
jgi:PBSX family phage terminase large subunit